MIAKNKLNEIKCIVANMEYNDRTLKNLNGWNGGDLFVEFVTKDDVNDSTKIRVTPSDEVRRQIVDMLIDSAKCSMRESDRLLKQLVGGKTRKSKQ